MAESSGSEKVTRKRSTMEDRVNPVMKKRKTEFQNKKKIEELDNRYIFRVLLPNACNLVITLEDPDQDMSVAEFVRTVKRRSAKNEVENSGRPIRWGSQCYLEDTMGNRIQDRKIIPPAPSNKPTIIVLQDGAANTLHTFQDMWDVTPEPHLLVGLPQEYTFETALADLIDNSLQALWANGPGERRLISVHIEDCEISIFDSGQGMDGSKENSIAKWGTMGSSNHRSVRGSAIGGRPPYLKPFFGMYGFGGLAASMHLGGLVIVSSKTKLSKKVVTLRLEKETLVQKSKADRIWRTAGDIREVTQEEREKSPHGSFTKVHICNLKSKYWNENKLKCMLKDIYFPYIQNDGSDESVRTSTPVEFEVNGTNLTEVEGGEVVATNLASCNAPPFVVELHLQRKHDVQGHSSSVPDSNGTIAEENANARICCCYFPICQGKERIDNILEKLDEERSGVEESFESFCRVSIRRLGRLLPDARWGRLPFMEPKRRRGDSIRVPQQCFKRVKCFVETDAGFAPTTSKTDLAHKHPFTLVLKNLGCKSDTGNHQTSLHIEREGKPMSLTQLERDYEEWIRAMHESYDEEVDCGDEKPLLIVNPCNKKDLGISQQVVRVLTQIRRKGQLWKASQKIKILKGAVGNPRNNLYATLEYILCEGLEGDPGEARLICRPMECGEDEGSRLLFHDGIPSLDIRSSRSFPLDLISSGKCQMVEEDTWKRQVDKKLSKAPAFIDILSTEQALKFDVDKGFLKGGTVQAGYVLPKEIIAVVRPHAFTVDNIHRALDGWDQKSIVKDAMEMKMDIEFIPRNECTSECSWGRDVKCSMQIKASSRNGVHGLYCFSTEGSKFLEMFTKVGRYKFIFSLVNNIYSNMSLEEEICVEPSSKVGKWKVCTELTNPELVEIKRLDVRLGSQIGPLYIFCYDVFSNRMPFKTYPELHLQVERMGKHLDIKIEKAFGRLAQDGMHLQISKIIFGGGNLELLRPSYEASLRVRNRGDSCFIETPMRVLPGELCSIRIVSSQALENCLRPGDVIHELLLQASDAFGNPVEKGQKIKVDLTGLEFQDQEDVHRKVDDQGYVNFGGLLKVIGNYGSKGSLIMSSDSHILLEKQFQFLIRELKVISEIPDQCLVGSVLENVVFGIFDDRGTIDTDINGRHHALMIDLYADNAIQYTFRHGKCMVPAIQLPGTPGTLTFQAFHSISTELNVQIKVDLISNPRLELLGTPNQGLNDRALTLCQGLDESPLAVCQVLEDRAVCQAHANDHFIDGIKAFNCSLMDDLLKLEEDVRGLAIKVKEREDRLKKLENHKEELNGSLLELEGQVEKCNVSTKFPKGIGNSQLNQVCHSVEQTLEEIRSQGSNAGALWVDLRRRQQSSQVPYLEDAIGIVALLGKVETDLVSRVLSEYLGKDNMLAIVCKSYKGVEGLEVYDPRGKIDERCGIHGLASAQNRQINGRFRIICLDDIRYYQGEFKTSNPQRLLNMDEPKLPNGKPPAGFMGYAVNMIHLDDQYLHSVTRAGHGLRESLFYHLFSCLQVYETRNYMKQARSYLTSGAISLDGGMIRCKGVLDFGNREEVAVMFPTISTKVTPSLFEHANQAKVIVIEEQIRQKTVCRHHVEGEIKHTQTLLHRALAKYEKKKTEMEEKLNQKKELFEHLEQHGLCLENLEPSALINSC